MIAVFTFLIHYSKRNARKCVQFNCEMRASTAQINTFVATPLCFLFISLGVRLVKMKKLANNELGWYKVKS